MKAKEVMEKALRGELRWIDAADILGISDRQMRRWRLKYQAASVEGLTDARLGRVPANRVPEATVARVLELYRTSYVGFNAKHFWEQLTEEHGIQVSYSWTKRLLFDAGHLQRHPRQRAYRRRRERRPVRGMLVHLDGSKHRWFDHPDGGMQDLLVMLDDATGEIIDGAFVPEESSKTVLALLRDVVRDHGTFAALYVDRASHFAHTPVAGGEIDRSRKTQVGRVLDELGIELICAYSPQARGRGERLWRTLQGRLPQELKRAGITSYEAATAYLRGRFRGRFNKRFAVAPAEEGTAFMPIVGVDLEALFSLRYERTVGNDYTLRFFGRVLQINKTPALSCLPRRVVQVRVTVDGALPVYLGARRLQTFSASPFPETRDDEEFLDVA